LGRSFISPSNDRPTRRGVGSSRRTISALENGNGEFYEAALRALAASLRFPYGFFFERLFVPGSEVLHFRRNAQVPEYALSRARAHAALFIKATRGFQTLAKFDPVKLPQSPDPQDTETIERLALAFRAAVGIDPQAPIGNATQTVEAAGIFVGTFEPAEAPIHGFACADRIPIVMLSASSCWSRRRLSVLHEVGHLAMHPEPGNSPDREKQAHRFAAATLIPRAAFFREFPRPVRQRFDWARLIAMKQCWGLSIQAIVYRAADLGLIDDAQKRTAFIHISRSGWRTSEPCEQAPEEPQVVAQVVEALSAERRIDELCAKAWYTENLEETLRVRVEAEEDSRVVPIGTRPPQQPSS
jgi:Zn-dependent peptidase ImmA (M78 family)